MAFRKILAHAMLSLTLFFSAAAHAQSSITDMLARQRLGVLDAGTYLAGDSIGFAIQNLGNNFLLRFQGTPEVFVLYADRASMGGRILKYDDGETAVRVTVWGGITLYTDPKPGGLPAVRIGDAQPLVLPTISLSDMQNQVSHDGQHLAFTRRLQISFTTDWNVIANNAALRAVYDDAMENAVRGVGRFTASASAREAMAKRVDIVDLTPSARPTVNMNGRTLLVTFNPSTGFVGRASSHAIARGLGKLLGVR